MIRNRPTYPRKRRVSYSIDVIITAGAITRHRPEFTDVGDVYRRNCRSDGHGQFVPVRLTTVYFVRPVSVLKRGSTTPDDKTDAARVYRPYSTHGRPRCLRDRDRNESYRLPDRFAMARAEIQTDNRVFVARDGQRRRRTFPAITVRITARAVK